MNWQRRAMEQENHTGEDVDTLGNALRVDYEDALVYAVDECLKTNSLVPFRDFALRYGMDAKWDAATLNTVVYNDDAAWLMVWMTGCKLRRLNPRWEHCANKLLERGINPPAGGEYLHI